MLTLRGPKENRDMARNSALNSQDGPLLITLTMQGTTFYAEAFNEINSDMVKTSFKHPEEEEPSPNRNHIITSKR